MSIFREYDIRGIVGKDLTTELAEKIGRAYGSRAVRAGAKAIAVGRDGRTSAPVMREAVLKGLLGCGLDRSEEHTSELQSRLHLVCRLLLEKKKNEACYSVAETYPSGWVVAR